jgi:hypothetical protein
MVVLTLEIKRHNAIKVHDIVLFYFELTDYSLIELLSGLLGTVSF